MKFNILLIVLSLILINHNVFLVNCEFTNDEVELENKKFEDAVNEGMAFHMDNDFEETPRFIIPKTTLSLEDECNAKCLKDQTTFLAFCSQLPHPSMIAMCKASVNSIKTSNCVNICTAIMTLSRNLYK